MWAGVCVCIVPVCVPLSCCITVMLSWHVCCDLCLCIRCTCASPCTAPVPHPTPVMTDAHPMAKQRPSEPSDDQSKPLFSSLYQL